MSQPRTAFAPDHLTASGDVRRGRAYAAARRHSTRVRILRVAIPLGALGALVLVPALMVLSPLYAVPGLTLGPISLSGSKVKMEGPRLTGFRHDARPYEVTATAAFQDIRRPNVVELRDMRAKLAIDAQGTSASLQSNLGIFDTAKEQLELSEEIRLATDRGDEALLKSASVNFKAGTVVSREPVRIRTNNLVLEAEGLEISDSGSVMSFSGRVRTQLLPSEPGHVRTAAPAPARVREAEAGLGR